MKEVALVSKENYPFLYYILLLVIRFLCCHLVQTHISKSEFRVYGRLTRFYAFEELVQKNCLDYSLLSYNGDGRMATRQNVNIYPNLT
jgi:adenine-specific DNA methylase